MTKRKANNCGECKHHRYNSNLSAACPSCHCEVGHKPRFYMPRSLTGAINDDWGWMRVCTDFTPLPDVAENQE